MSIYYISEKVFQFDLKKGPKPNFYLSALDKEEIATIAATTTANPVTIFAASP